MIKYKRLASDEYLKYSNMTFPAYRNLLTRLEPAGPYFAVGALFNGSPAGLALGKIHEERKAEVLSVFVDQNYRCRKIGEGLLSELEKIFKEMNCAECALVYMTGKPATPMFEKLLLKSGYSDPEFRKLVCRASCKSFLSCGWEKYLKKLPAEYKIISWNEVSEADREQIRQSNEINKWIAPDLMPFDFENGCEPINSLAMRYRGDIVGWVINHRIAFDLIRYTCSFLRPDLQKAGRIVAMYYESLLRQNAVMPFSHGIWTVPSWHVHMIDFARRHMAPHLTSMSETREVKKIIRKAG
ncbi:MAG: GCN5-related N-acetyltransferase [uncultured bacterium]|uniref:N-acetyltransferase domain-containing protein n=1 Tax=Candidatus Wallbacteria bacterium GWC2_49_35 TaxID=1817813 RepID=A0A1F7WLG2_9BACT|nr:MAG: GCN5-related N-acetyltransferase [uncultured bacterium]OGM03671.1 MAG: hypothetical protein A2008_08415 [Candidatus Wallbacteria bacterium GWC2_49_35]HBC76031.1 GNAT family N-acetyltransferase [Candidatus Wallbacteria bacterium]